MLLSGRVLLNSCNYRNCLLKFRTLYYFLFPTTAPTMHFEAWTIIRDNEALLGKSKSSILPIPNWQSEQNELVRMYERLQQKHMTRKQIWPFCQRTWPFRKKDYVSDLERRLNRLEPHVRHAIYHLVKDRTAATRTDYAVWEWRVVALMEVPGGRLTDAPAALSRRHNPGKDPVVEYRVILRGRVVKRTSKPWRHYDRWTSHC